MGTHVGMGLRCYGYWQLVTFCSIELCLQQLPVYLCLFTVVPSSALSRLCQSAFNKKTGDRDENLLIGRCNVLCLISIYLQPDDRLAVASGTEEEVDLLPKSESNKSHRPSMVEINHSGYSNQEIVYWLQLLYFFKSATNNNCWYGYLPPPPLKNTCPPWTTQIPTQTQTRTGIFWHTLGVVVLEPI